MRRRRVRHDLLQFTSESLLPEAVAIGCLLLLLWAGIGLSLYHERTTAEAAAVQSTGNLARVFEENTRRTVGQIDQILLSIRAVRAAEGDRFDFHQWVRAQMPPGRMTVTIGTTDVDGLVTAATLPFPPGVSIVDRPHFQAQKDPARDELFIGKPALGRVSGQYTLQFTRKLQGPQGEFDGVAVLALDCVELSRFYQTLDLGSGFVALLSADGTVLARGPLVPDMIGRSIADARMFADMKSASSGVVRFFGTRTGLGQLASYRRLPDYPLIVMVGSDTDTVFRQYRALRSRAVAGGVGGTLAISVIGALWLRQKRRNLETRHALGVTLETISQGILMVDRAGNVPVVNTRALNLLGVATGSGAQTVRRNAAARAADLAERSPGAAQRMLPSSDLPPGDARFETSRDDGTVVEVRSHRLAQGGFVQTYTDVTEQRLADARVRFLADHDVLTGLANRWSLRQRLPELLQDSEERQLFAAFMLIDLDGFKSVNDTLGHDVGDELLIEMGRRLQGLVRQADFVARLGGDEFVVVLPGLHQPDAAFPLARRILQRLAEPAQIGDHRLRIGASIGIAFHPRDARSADALLKYADTAMYAAKATGRGMFCCFDSRMTSALNERRLLESGLQRALEIGALRVDFQPIFTAHSLEFAGFEALARWPHPEHGFVPPDTFIRIAEDCGLINPLGQWVTEEACASVASWGMPCRIAVNVSPVQFREGRLQDDIATILRSTGLPPELLELEVTESVLADSNQAILSALNDLKAMGVRIALDDFGTGYSSLSYLRRFSFDKIKIDKSFVQGQSNDQGVRVILEAILNMCRNLGLAVVGEGVETHQQLTMLQEAGCTEVQGYLLGRPMTAQAAEEFLCGNPGRSPDRSGSTLQRHSLLAS